MENWENEIKLCINVLFCFALFFVERRQEDCVYMYFNTQRRKKIILRVTGFIKKIWDFCSEWETVSLKNGLQYGAALNKMRLDVCVWGKICMYFVFHISRAISMYLLSTRNVFIFLFVFTKEKRTEENKINAKVEYAHRIKQRPCKKNVWIRLKSIDNTLFLIFFFLCVTEGNLDFFSQFCSFVCFAVVFLNEVKILIGFLQLNSAFYLFYIITLV